MNPLLKNSLSTINANQTFDYTLIGFGLSNALCLNQIISQSKDSTVLVIEKNSSFPSRTFSFFKSDITENQYQTLKPFLSYEWQDYSVKFPTYEKTFNVPYCSITASEFLQKIKQSTTNKNVFWLQDEVLSLENQKIILKSGTTITSKKILNSKYNVSEGNSLSFKEKYCGYQKFLGLEVLLENLHPLDTPIIMDATVKQVDGFRFLYVLPLSTHSLLLEDTYYSENDHLNLSEIESRIYNYAQEKGWRISKVIRKEWAALEIPFSTKYFSPKPLNNNLSIINLGLNAHYFHPVTGFSLPFAARASELLFGSQKKTKVISKAFFYLLLTRMLFLASEPKNRYKIFERFYKLSPALIARFYAGRSYWWDCIRILIGKPPVPISKAIKSLFLILTEK